MKRIKGILSIILTASILAACIPAYADGEITAEEVKTLIEANFLSNQSYCEEILDTWVYNEDNIFENKTLRDYIDPEKTIVYSYYDDTKNVFLPQTAMEVGALAYCNEDNTALDISISTNLRIEGISSTYVMFNALKTKMAQINYGAPYLDGDIFPFFYLDYEKTADMLNGYKLKNITEIAFQSLELIVRADEKTYYVAPYECEETGGFDEGGEGTETYEEYKQRRKDLFEKKRALTPPDLIKYLEWESIDPEQTDSLSKYKNTPAVFSDLGDDEFLCQAAALLKDRGIITGFEDGTLRPDSTLTRGEAAVMLKNLVRGDYTGEDFPDTQDHWAQDAINYLTGAGVIHGYDNGLFRPDTELTYEQACGLVYSIMGYNANFYEPNKMYKMMRCGLLKGLSSFTKEKPISRSDFIKIIANAFDTSIEVGFPSLYGSTDPSFGYTDDITLVSYLDGKEPQNGEYCLSYEAYKAWEDDIKERCYEAYKDLKE